MKKLIPAKRTRKAPCGCDINLLEQLTQTSEMKLIDKRELETRFYECGLCGALSEIQTLTKQNKRQLMPYEGNLTRNELIQYAPNYKGTIDPEDEEYIIMRR